MEIRKNKYRLEEELFMDYRETIGLLKELTEAKGISGNEKEASRVMKRYLEGYADEFEYDNLGSLIAIKKGDSDLRVMLSGHLDEVGFIVSKIEEDGYLRISPVGGWWAHVLPSQKMTVMTYEGKSYMGVVGSIPPHGMKPEVRNKVMEIKDLYIDLGVANKKEVEELGICVGDSVVPYTEFMVMNNPDYVCSKAFDDRIGAAVCIEVMRRLKGEKHPNTLYSVGSVQEEVGLRGARTSAYHIKPDIAIAIDVSMSGDVPGADRIESKLGNGVALSVMDGSVIGHKGLIKMMENICKDKNIKYTYDSLVAGGTDSGEISKVYDGVVNMTLSIPCRYFHSHNSVVNLKDYEACVELLVEFVKRLDENRLNELKEEKQ